MITLELAWSALIAACIAYGHGLFSRRGGGDSWGQRLLGSAWILLTTQLVHRWYVAGLWQPPWLYLGQAMELGVWALLGMQLVCELIFKSATTGLFTASFAAAVCGVLAWGPVGQVHPVGLKESNAYLLSPWAFVHVPSGVFSYALIFISGFLAVMALIRMQVRNERFFSALAALALVSLSGTYGSFPAVSSALIGFSVFLVLSTFGLWLESQDRRIIAQMAEHEALLVGVPRPPKQRKGLRRAQRLIFFAAWIALLGALWGVRGVASPYLMVWLVFLALLAGVVQLLPQRRKLLEERLPEAQDLDRWSYQSALYAFPLLTIHLVSGSVWAYDAWGSSWSWQPQQGWVFVAWLYVALLLHLERGRMSTTIATCAGILWVLVALASNAARSFWPALG